jgi:hypothetical protein
MVQQAPILPNLLITGSEITHRSNEVKISAIKKSISGALQAKAL